MTDALIDFARIVFVCIVSVVVLFVMLFAIGHLVPSPWSLLAILFAIAVWWGIFRAATACPACGKQLKTGYMRCHHCGHTRDSYSGVGR